MISGLEQYEEDVQVAEDLDKERELVLYNDDHNTFDFVIECLMLVCKHSLEQAEQCTILVHYKGKCTVKSDALKVLKPMREQLANFGLKAKIK
ncbi:MAG: ATP-dependent Clp protease adaptor ClpS [Flavobacteriaceae bacterium]|nr:ATP-dependent Clp protease adaptor ClpS [Flavobacteriaceae bacterium]